MTEHRTETLSTAERIRVAMAEKGWTQVQLAAATGINQGEISRYIRGRVNPNAATVDKIMRALGGTHTLGAVDGVLGIQGRAPGKLIAVNPLGEAPPVSWVLEGVVAREAVTMIAGEPGAGKSFLTQTIAVSMANGQEHVIGCKLHGRHVLIVDAENGEQLIQRRSRAMGLHEDAVDYYSVAAADGFDMERDRDALGAILSDYAEAGNPVDLVIFDSWTSTWTGNENVVEQVQRCLNRLRDMARTHHVGVLLIHHTDKAGEDYRGSGAIAATIEAVFTFARADENEPPNARWLKCRKMRLDAEPAAALLYLTANGVEAPPEVQ